MPDINREASEFWNSLKPMIDEEIKAQTRGMVQRRKMKVTTAPSLNTNKIGVTEPFGTEMLIPFTTNLISATVGDVVWVEFMYGLTNAFASMFASADEKDWDVAGDLSVVGDAGIGGNLGVSGATSLQNTTVNGVLDITPRRCYEILSNEGWYRVCAISFNSYDEAIGALGGILRFAITDSYSDYPNDAHTIDLLLTHNKVTFVAEQSAANGYLEIDKIRYTVTGNSPYYGYVDVHFMGRGGTTYVGISFDYTVVGLDRQERAVAQSLQSVPASPSGETVLTEYTFSVNTFYHDDNTTSGVRHIVDRRGDIVTVTIESAGSGINCPAGQYTTVYTLPSDLSPAGSVYTVVDAYGGNNIISGLIDTSGRIQLYPVLSSTNYYRFTLTYTIN